MTQGSFHKHPKRPKITKKIVWRTVVRVVIYNEFGTPALLSELQESQKTSQNDPREPSGSQQLNEVFVTPYLLESNPENNPRTWAYLSAPPAKESSTCYPLAIPKPFPGYIPCREDFHSIRFGW